MAKRYYTYDDLLTINTGQTKDDGYAPHKPEGTMGSHHFALKYHQVGDTVHVVVHGYSSSGKNVNTATIRPGDTLGYNCGKVWRIPAPMNSWERYKQKFRVSVKYVPRNNWKIKRDVPYRTLYIYDNPTETWGYLDKDEPIPHDAFMLIVEDMWVADLQVRRSRKMYIDPSRKEEAVNNLIRIYDHLEERFEKFMVYVQYKWETINGIE